MEEENNKNDICKTAVMMHRGKTRRANKNDGCARTFDRLPRQEGPSADRFRYDFRPGYGASKGYG